MLIQPRLLSLGLNLYGRDFVVGDIHGCVSALLEQLQQEHAFDPTCDRVICAGDLIDRGPESAEALALLDKPWFFSVIGNHEQLFVEAFREGNAAQLELILKHGGDWAQHYSVEQWQRFFAYIDALPLAIELENKRGEKIAVIHADYPLANWQDFSQLTPELAKRAIWAREPFQQQLPGRIEGIDWMIYGHNVTEQELRIDNRLYIDAGVFLNRRYFIKDIDQLGE